MSTNKVRQDMLRNLVVSAVRKAHKEGRTILSFEGTEEALEFLEAFQKVETFLASCEEEGLAPLKKLFSEVAGRVEEHKQLLLFRVDCDPRLRQIAMQLGETLPDLGKGN